MAVELQVNGFFEVSFMDILTQKEVSEETEKEILKKLNNGTYIYGMDSKTIFNLDDFIPMYKVVMDATDALNYEWNEL